MPSQIVCLPNFRTTEVVWMEIMHFLRPSLFFLVEQPSGSWAYKQACMIAAVTLLQMWLVYALSFCGWWFGMLCFQKPFTVFNSFRKNGAGIAHEFWWILKFGRIDEFKWILYIFVCLATSLRMCIKTWLCYWGHDLLKCTHLLSNCRHRSELTTES